MAISVMIRNLYIASSNDILIEEMKEMKAARESRSYDFILCCISGFNDDARELYEIPEVRAFCRRLVNTAFISYLEWSAFLHKHLPEDMRAGLWGSLEVWMCSEGILSEETELTEKHFAEFEKVLRLSNGKADSMIGPMKL